MEAPEAIEITKRAFCMSDMSCEISGAQSPAAVIIATVAEPCNNLTSTAEINEKKKILIPLSAKKVASMSPASVFMSICSKISSRMRSIEPFQSETSRLTKCSMLIDKFRLDAFLN